jgi:hypothetical protein
MKPKHRSSPPPPPLSLDHKAAKEAVMGMATAASRPLLIGVAALRLGSFWSIERTQELFQELEDEGLLRPLSGDEKLQYGMSEGFVVSGVKSQRAV